MTTVCIDGHDRVKQGGTSSRHAHCYAYNATPTHSPGRQDAGMRAAAAEAESDEESDDEDFNEKGALACV